MTVTGTERLSLGPNRLSEGVVKARVALIDDQITFGSLVKAQSCKGYSL
jgi:hypothetical protein